MRPKKKPLALKRETLRQLGAPELAEAHGGINVKSVFVCVPATQQHSCFDSCYNTDCCLEVP